MGREVDAIRLLMSQILRISVRDTGELVCPSKTFLKEVFLFCTITYF